MRISNCRICRNKKLVKIGSLGKIAISDFSNKPFGGIKFPLELVYCENCTLLQLRHNTPRYLLYQQYWYKSGLNPVVVKDLKEIASLCRGNLIDIGGNDGTLLKYATLCTDRICVDPSDITPDGFFQAKCYWEDFRGLEGAYHTITAIACLYDLPDPNKFIENVKRHLHEKGIFISQFQPLSEMVELNDVGNICHEHIEYYSYKSLVYLFEHNGLEIFKVERNKMNGGSYRVFARHYRKGSIKFDELEYSIGDLWSFFNRIEQNKNKFWDWAVEAQPEIIGYGASTKANTILQYYGIKHLTIVDINPEKLGMYPVTSSVKIIDKIPKDCDYLWVFPYGFIDYFKKKEKKYKGKWITTIPQFNIL